MVAGAALCAALASAAIAWRPALNDAASRLGITDDSSVAPMPAALAAAAPPRAELPSMRVPAVLVVETLERPPLAAPKTSARATAFRKPNARKRPTTAVAKDYGI
jgi:hypothetical protein